MGLFFPILNDIFFLIYRKSDQKGLWKLWTSFKIAVFISVAGLIITPAEAQELN